MKFHACTLHECMVLIKILCIAIIICHNNISVAIRILQVYILPRVHYQNEGTLDTAWL